MNSLYVHIPFCEKKCFYCSFAVSIGQENRVDEYLQVLEKEMEFYKGVSLRTIYIGGGTPSFLNENQIEKLFCLIKENFQCNNVIEWTFEINPESITEYKAKLLKAFGVNRISLGLQSTNNQVLEELGRNHNSEKGQKAFYLLRECGFENISVDLIFSLPDQRIEQIEEDLRQIIKMNCEHISLYSLEVEKNSRLFAKNIIQLDENIQKDQYAFVCQYLNTKGYLQYEISNYAKKGRNSLHNINHWQGGNYIGIGMDAHSHFDGLRVANVDKFMEYLKRGKEGQKFSSFEERLDSVQRFLETFLFGLRMNEGVNISCLEKRFKVNLTSEKLGLVNQYVEQGFLCWENEILKTTSSGRLVLDELSSRLI